eukprot:8141142-Alexandrium_andersonii.AAC.1
MRQGATSCPQSGHQSRPQCWPRTAAETAPPVTTASQCVRPRRPAKKVATAAASSKLTLRRPR